MTQKNSTTQATPDSERELERHLAVHAALTARAPDPWDVATPATVEQVKAEAADVIAEAGEQVKAAFDEALQVHAQLAGAVAVINQDSDQIAALRSKRARALKTARTRGRRWHQAAESTRKARAKLAAVRAELDAAQHSIANKDSIIALLQGNLNAAHLKNMELESTLINKHADEYDPTSEAAQLADDLAAARARIDELVKTVNGLRQDAERNSRRMDTTPIKATVDHAAQSDAVALRDQMTDLLAVLREYGYVAYENETRVKPEAWLRQRLANIGEPVKGGASKPAAS